MPVNALLLLRLLLIVVLLTATGCPQVEQPSASTENPAPEPATTETTPAETDGLPTDYHSHMAFSVDLLDPSTGLPMPTKLETLTPTILREVDRITNEPIIRQVLNKQAVRETAWFKQYESDLDTAVQAFEQSIVARHVPGTPIFRVYVLRSLQTEAPEDAQTILRALSDEYMRQRGQLISVSINEKLTAAQKALSDAEGAVASITAQLKRHMQNNPISSGSIDRSRVSAMESESLQQQLRQAQERQDVAIRNIAAIHQQTNGFMGYIVTQEYAPESAVAATTRHARAPRQAPRGSRLCSHGKGGTASGTSA